MAEPAAASGSSCEWSPWASVRRGSESASRAERENFIVADLDTKRGSWFGVAHQREGGAIRKVSSTSTSLAADRHVTVARRFRANFVLDTLCIRLLLFIQGHWLSSRNADFNMAGSTRGAVTRSVGVARVVSSDPAPLCRSSSTVHPPALSLRCLLPCSPSPLSRSCLLRVLRPTTWWRSTQIRHSST